MPQVVRFVSDTLILQVVRFVSDTLILQVVRFVSEHPHPTGGGDVHQGDRGQKFISEHPHPTGGEVCIRPPSSHRW